MSFNGSFTVSQREDNLCRSIHVLFSLTCSQDKTQFLSRHNEQLFILSFANNGSHTEGYFKNYLGLLYFMPVYMKQMAWIGVMHVYMCG